MLIGSTFLRYSLGNLRIYANMLWKPCYRENAKGVRKALHSRINGCAKQSLRYQNHPRQSNEIVTNFTNLRIISAPPKKKKTHALFSANQIKQTGYVCRKISLRRGPSLWCQKATGSSAVCLGFTFGLSSGGHLGLRRNGACFGLGTWQVESWKTGKTVASDCISSYIYILYHLRSLCLVFYIYIES